MIFNESIYIPITISIVFTMCFFIGIITYISKHPKKNTSLLKIIFLVMFIVGMVMYCYFHYKVLEEAVSGELSSKSLNWVQNENSSWFYNVYYIFYIVMRSAMDVGMMFYGRSNSEVFYSLPESGNPLFVLGFWLLHTIAFFAASSALIIRFGDNFLRWFRWAKTKVSDVDLIFGINDNSLVVGRNIADEEGSMLVYVDSTVSEDYESSIHNLGGIVYSNKEALKATVSFLKDIRIKKGTTKFRIFLLSRDYDKNLQYAQMMSESLKELQIQPEQTRLILLGTNEQKGMIFQFNENQYGYGNVLALDEFEMNARLLIHEYPPCNAINFDSEGRATENMEVLIVGVGRMGHEVLRKVIANGQFEGSKFHATIYEPIFIQRTGFFESQYPNMYANYNIDFELRDIKGRKFFKFLQKNAVKLKYIVICLEDREISRNLAINVVDRLQTLGYSQDVYTCDSQGIRCYSAEVQKCKTYWLYDSALLYSGDFDKYAMELNHRYTQGDGIEEDWKQCDYFGRMSSRASVDYLIPLIRRIKKLFDINDLTYEQRENMAKSEHLRWCAFHYTFGYDVMGKEEFVQRIEERQDEIKRLGKSKFKTSKNEKERRHVCLVDWDELDDISRLENSLTNGNKDYKGNDRINVDMVMEIITDEESQDPLQKSRE